MKHLRDTETIFSHLMVLFTYSYIDWFLGHPAETGPGQGITLPYPLIIGTGAGHGGYGGGLGPNYGGRQI